MCNTEQTLQQDDKNISELINKLKVDTKIVAYARFNKVQRLKSQTNYSLLSISLLSFVLIIASILEQKLGINQIYILAINKSIPIWYFSILSSIFILTISVYIAKNNFETQITNLYDSGVKIRFLSRKLDVLMHEHICSESLHAKYLVLLDEYKKILENENVNHDLIDYHLEKYKISDVLYWCYLLKHYITTTTTYYLLIIALSIYTLISMSIQVISLC